MNLKKGRKKREQSPLSTKTSVIQLRKPMQMQLVQRHTKSQIHSMHSGKGSQHQYTTIILWNQQCQCCSPLQNVFWETKLRLSSAAMIVCLEKKQLHISEQEMQQKNEFYYFS